MRYRLELSIQPRERAIERARKEAGCFVLLSNEPAESAGGLSSKELLQAYQDQHSIERNCGFLKDPVFVNALFLKAPRRIEAPGLILVLALMVRRLMERTMQLSLKERGSKITGWNKRPTSRPTSFMMTTTFPSVIVLKTRTGRYLPNPPDSVQRPYLEILGLSESVFTDPSALCMLEPGYAPAVRAASG